MTRRNFIKVGLAASAFVSSTKGTPIHSAIAARNSRGLSNNIQWENPYITDGLIAMWDGEWNAGWGLHDDNAVVWKDLTGNGCDATLSGAYSWGEKSWNVESVTKQGLATWSISGPFTSQTIEIVVHPTASQNWGRIIGEWSNMGSLLIRTGPVVWIYGWNWDQGQVVQGFNEFALHSHQLVYKYNDSFDYYIDRECAMHRDNAKNGSLGGVCYFANRSPDYARGIDAMYYCVRIYNRALTPEELAYNYAIDKERFNLP